MYALYTLLNLYSVEMRSIKIIDGKQRWTSNRSVYPVVWWKNRTSLAVGDRIKIIDEVKKVLKRKIDIVSEFGILASAWSTILKDEDVILNCVKFLQQPNESNGEMSDNDDSVESP